MADGGSDRETLRIWQSAEKQPAVIIATWVLINKSASFIDIEARQVTNQRQ